MEQNNRIYGLDIFRSVAILLVLVAHGNLLLKNTDLEGFPWIRLIDGVDLFFVLSGFLIGSILIREYSKNETFSIHLVFSFWKRRWLRTLPLYYLFLFINFFLIKFNIVDGDIKQFKMSFLFFCHNISSPFYDFFWESWSLSVEEWFYILFPLFLITISVFVKKKWAFFLTCLTLIISPLVYRWNISSQELDSFWFDVTFRKVVLARIDSIGFGVLAAWFKYYYFSSWIKYKYIMLLFSVVILLIVLNIDKNPNGFYDRIFSLTFLPFGAMLSLSWFDGIRNYSNYLGRIITHISKISYSMYLVNLTPVAMVILKQFSPKGGVDSLVKYFIYWTVVIICSSLLYAYFEKPILSLRKDISRKEDI